jgi:hypothetical protein
MAAGALTANLMGIGGSRAHTKGYADIRHFLPDFGLSFPQAGAAFFDSDRVRPLADSKPATYFLGR